MTECDGDCLVGVLSVQYEGDAPIYKSDLYQGYQDSKDFTWYNYCPFCGKEVEHGKEVGL
jgi:hypothetical protein